MVLILSVEKMTFSKKDIDFTVVGHGSESVYATMITA